MKKRLLAALMASMMCLSMLAGCGNQDNSTGGGQEDGNKNTPAPSSNTAAPAAATPAPEFEQTWPDGQVITWMVRDDNATADYTRYYDLKAIKMIEDKLHVDIQFIPFNGKDQAGEEKGAAQARYLTYVGDEANRADVIGYMHNDVYKEKGGVGGLYNDGICIDLTDLINTKIPNLKKIFEEHPDIARDMSDGDGRILYLEQINPLATDKDRICLTTTGVVMRKDWLDAVGMDVPTNMKEWYDVLVAFKTMDPNGNNKQDEIPFEAYSSGIQMFEAAYGMLSKQYIDPDTGKVEFGPRTQKYKEYLTEMNKWFTEDLMFHVYGDDGKSTNISDGDSNVTGGIAGSWKGLSNNDTKFAAEMRKNGQPDAELVAVPWPATTSGTVYSQRGVSRLQKNTVIVTTNCAKDQKKLDAVAAVFNYMLSEEGSLLLTWGEEGVTFTTDEKGNRILTEQGNAPVSEETGASLGFPNYKGSSKPQLYKMYGNQADCLVCYGNFDVQTATRDAWYIESATTWADANFDLIYPDSIILTKEQKDRLGDSQLDDYIAAMTRKFIIGEEPLSNFDTYLAELERMGVSERVKVYQEAYDAYMKK